MDVMTLADAARRVDGYVTTADLGRLVTDFDLASAFGAPNVVLRASDHPHVSVIALVGADLAESTDPREHSEGLRLLADTLERFAR